METVTNDSENLQHCGIRYRGIIWYTVYWPARGHAASKLSHKNYKLHRSAAINKLYLHYDGSHSECVYVLL